MKRHKALHSLSQEHHHGLMLAQLIKSGSPQYNGLPKTLEDKKSYTVKFFKENLALHFQKEEEFLFPFSRNKTEEIDKQTAELIDQHKKIYSIIDKLEVSDSVQKDLDELGKLLEAHIRKEERELFQLIQEALSSAELEKLANELGKPSNTCNI